MIYQKVEREQWKVCFDLLSKVLGDSEAMFEVVGLDIGDQLEADWLPLFGITYDRADDAVYVNALDPKGVHLDHAIASPKEIWLELREEGLSLVTLMDSEGRKQFVRLREPVPLSDEAWEAAAHPHGSAGAHAE